MLKLSSSTTSLAQGQALKDGDLNAHGNTVLAKNMLNFYRSCEDTTVLDLNDYVLDKIARTRQWQWQRSVKEHRNLCIWLSRNLAISM